MSVDPDNENWGHAFCQFFSFNLVIYAQCILSKNLFVTNWGEGGRRNSYFIRNSLRSRSQPTSLVKGQIVNISGFTSHTVSTATTQFCYYSMKEATDDMQTKWVWSCCNKTCATETGGGSDSACRSQFADSRSVTLKKNRLWKETKHKVF